MRYNYFPKLLRQSAVVTARSTAARASRSLSVVVMAVAITRISANEVRRVIGAAVTPVYRNLGVGTQGSRAIYYAVGGVRCEDSLGGMPRSTQRSR